MAEPVTVVVGGYLFGLVSDVACNMIAGRADARLQAFLDRRVNNDIQDALRKAWKAACAELFQRYREDPTYGSLRPDHRDVVKARSDLYVAPATIEALFPSSPGTAALTVDDVNRLFDVGHDEVNQALLDGLTRLGLLGDLPGGLERQIRESLLKGLLFHFIELGIKRDGKARDAIFFEQLLAVRKGTAATEDELRAVHARLEQLDEYQQWQRQMLTKIAAGVDELLDRVKPPSTTVPHSIPAPPTDFQGRGEEIETLVSMLGAAKEGTVAGICGVRGLGGIGKSVLAQKVAHDLRDTFDAQILIALRGTSDNAVLPEEALREVLRAFGKETDPSLTLAQLENDYRATLHGRRVLILADNAKDVAQVKPLTPPAGSALLITSRRLIRFADMPEPVELGKLGEEEAVALVLKLCPKLGADATTLTTLCGCLPLALRLSATRIAHSSSPIARQLTQLADERTRLRRMHGDDPEADIEAAFNQSFAALSDDAQTLLRRLGMFAASFERGAAVEVARLPGMIDDEYALDDVLDELRNLSLIDHDLATDRYSLHDLVRIFALERLRQQNEEQQTRLHYIVHYLTQARIAQAQFLQGGEDLLIGLQLFDRERMNINALWTWAIQLPPDETRDALLIALADATAFIGDLRYDKRKERIPQLEAALAAAQRQGKRSAEINFLNNLGNASSEVSDFPQAIAYYNGALTVSRAIGHRRGESNALGNLGLLHDTLGDSQKAISYFQQQMVIVRELGDYWTQGVVLNNLSLACIHLRMMDQAISYGQPALIIARETGNRQLEGAILGNLGLASRYLHDLHNAIAYYKDALTIARQIGDRRGEGIACDGLSLVYRELGDIPKAVEYSEAALTIFIDIGDSHTANATSGRLLKTYRALIELGKLDEAAAAIERARALLSDAPRLAELEAALARAWGDAREAGGA